jgi:hypothetical protein
MQKSTLIWTVILLLAGGYIVFRTASGDMGQAYVRAVKVPPDVDGQTETLWTKYVDVHPRMRNEPNVSFSWPRTIGLWVAAFLSLALFSFLYGDNVFYKLAESFFIGVSAAYVMVVGFWTGIVQNLLSKLIPDLIRDTVLPGLKADQAIEYSYFISLVLSALLLMRLSPKGGWISRWPLAFFIGATAGMRLVGFFEADFVSQIQNTLLPLVVFAEDGSFEFWNSWKNVMIVIGVVSSLVYFYFSFEHTGVVGGVSKLGIWMLMITFGAGFAYTVMGRIALLAQRLEFLFDDWLWIIDPIGKRTGM